MSLSFSPLNITLGPESPVFSYYPSRNANASEGWNAMYTGSTFTSQDQLGTPGSGTPYRLTQTDHAGVSLTFTGTAAYFCLTYSGSAQLWFGWDGVPGANGFASMPTAASSQCPTTDAGVVPDLLATPILPYGEHTVSLNVSISGQTDSVSFYGGSFTAGVSTNKTLTPVWVDDRNPDWRYLPADGGVWSQIEYWAEDYNATHTFSCAYSGGTTAAYAFNGSYAVQLIGIADYNSFFPYMVTLNAGNEAIYSATNSWRSDRQTMYFVDGLDPTQTYNLLLSNFDPGDPTPETQSCIYIDALVLYQDNSSSSASTSSPTSSGSQLPPGPTTSPSSDDTASAGLTQRAKAGIAVGAILGAVLIAVVAFLLWRAARRSGRNFWNRMVDSAREEALATAFEQMPDPYLGVIASPTDSPAPSRKSMVEVPGATLSTRRLPADRVPMGSEAPPEYSPTHASA